MIVLEVSDDRFCGGPAPQRPLDGLGAAALVAGDMDPEHHLVLRRIVAAITGVGDDLAEGGADRGLDGGDDGGQRVAVVGIARQRPSALVILRMGAAFVRRGHPVQICQKESYRTLTRQSCRA